MGLIWTPTGTLNVAADPADLKESLLLKGGITSGDMQRCKNLDLGRSGVIETRKGSSKFNTSALSAAIKGLAIQGGTRYTLGDSDIYEDETSLSASVSGTGYWASVQYNPYNSTTQAVYALNGTDKVRIEGSTVYNWGITAPTVAPTLAVGSLTGLTGDYNAKYTYCRKEGDTVVVESNPSPAASSAATLANESLDVTWTASADPQVTHVRIYRSQAGGSLYYHDQDVAIGTVTVDSNTSDGSLGSQVATDHDIPPAGQYVAGPTYEGVLFIIEDNKLWFCEPKQPDYWPAANYIEVSKLQDPGKCLVFYNGVPYFITETSIYHIQGTSSSTFYPLPMESLTGCQGPNAACSVRGKGIYHVGADGIYLFSTFDQKVSQTEFEPIFNGETSNGMPGVGDLSTSWVFSHSGKLYFGYASADDSYPKHCIVYNFESGRQTYFAWPFEIVVIAPDKADNRLVAVDSDGYVWHLENPDEDTDGDTAISWDVQTKDYTLPTRAHFPRWVKYDVDASGATTAIGALYLGTTSHQTHTLSSSYNTKRRLVTPGNGSRASVRIYGTGPVTIRGCEFE